MAIPNASLLQVTRLAFDDVPPTDKPLLLNPLLVNAFDKTDNSTK